MKWLRTRTAVRSLVPIGVLTISLVLACAGPGPDESVAPIAAATRLDRNVERGRATDITIEQDFRTEHDLFLEVYPSSADAYATLWPLTQLIAGDLTSRRLGQINATASVTAFDPYWDAAATPPGYSASMQPPLGSGDRKVLRRQRLDRSGACPGVPCFRRYGRARTRPATLRLHRIRLGRGCDARRPRRGVVVTADAQPALHPSQHRLHGRECGAWSAAVRGRRRSEPYYLDWATRMYTWVNTYLRGSNGLYGDHVDLAGVVDPGQLTYNQGTMIGASVLLYRSARDPTLLQTARTIADTSLGVFGPDFSQPPAYNAVFFRNLLLLGADTGDNRYRAAAQAYADHVWDTLRDPSTGMFDFVYGRNRAAEPHRLLDQAAMLQIYAALALGRRGRQHHVSVRRRRAQRAPPLQRFVAPFAHCSAVGSEANLIGWREVIGSEECNLCSVVARLQRAAGDKRTIQNDDAVLTRIVEVTVDAKEWSELDDQASFLSDLTPGRLLDILAIFDEPARDVPVAFPRFEFAPRQPPLAVVLDNAAARGRWVPVMDLPAATAHTAEMLIELAFDRGSAAGCAEADYRYHTTRHVSVWRTPTAPAMPEVIQLPNDCMSGLST